MSEKSGFFNAVQVDGVYDRKYNANDYCDNMAVVIGNGVLRSVNDDLKVTASGMVCSVAAGRAWVNGHWYSNETTYTFTATSATVSANRYDRIMLRLDNQLLARKVSLVYVQGTEAATPTKPAPTRTADVYDLVLADIYVQANTASVTVTDMRADTSVCGWVYSTSGDNSFFTSLDASFMEWFNGAKNTLSSVTLFKKYTQTITLAAASSSVAFSIPQYDADTCFIEVYVNGVYDNGYTLSNSTLTFDGSLIAGTNVTVNVYKSIDGTGIQTISGEITQLQNQVAQIIGTNKFVYTCTGSNDNVALSEIAQAIYTGSYTAASVSTAAAAFLSAIGGNTYLAALAADAQVEIDVVGRIGVTSAAAGAGTAVSQYRWFNVGISSVSTKKLIIDFAKCEKIAITCAANTSNIIFYGTDLDIRNANVSTYSNATSCAITMSQSGTKNGYVNFENCRLIVNTSGNALIADNGNFTNCYCYCKSSTGDAICFDSTNSGLVRLLGGTYYAYICDTSKVASIMRIVASDVNAVMIAHSINAPTVSLSGYTQRNLAISAAGNMYINGVVSTMTSTGATVTIQGQIWKSKR